MSDKGDLDRLLKLAADGDAGEFSSADEFKRRFWEEKLPGWREEAAESVRPSVFRRNLVALAAVLFLLALPVGFHIFAKHEWQGGAKLDEELALLFGEEAGVGFFQGEAFSFERSGIGQVVYVLDLLLSVGEAGEHDDWAVSLLLGEDDSVKLDLPQVSGTLQIRRGESGEPLLAHNLLIREEGLEPRLCENTLALNHDAPTRSPDMKAHLRKLELAQAREVQIGGMR